MNETKVVTTEDILLKLCNSVTGVFSKATGSEVHHASMVQRINKTSLSPDLGCFVLFDGGFSGLVVINFTAAAAVELYQDYMKFMGIPESELASHHTADEVGDTLGELMNQILGDFIGKIGKDLQTVINQNQPKMLAINKNVNVSIGANLDCPEVRRVSFRTANYNPFYLELAVDKIEFFQLREFEEEEDINPDDIIAAQMNKKNKPAEPMAQPVVDDDFLNDLGI